jgi:hypothetical protein
MSEADWVPGSVPMDRPSPARIYDYFLGGFHNFEVDREAAERLLQVHPDVRIASCVNRAYLRRAVLFLLEQGIDQFLDIGSGIPTAGNVHEVAQKVNPASRVAYVDIDPVAVAHSRRILHGNPRAVAIRADARKPEEILDHQEIRTLLDFGKPMAILLVGMLHLVPDDAEAHHTVEVLRSAVVSGSYLVLSHPSLEDVPSRFLDQINALTESARSRYQYRPAEKIERFFEGLELFDPGLVHAPLWRPEGPDDLLLDTPARAFCLAAVAHKP